MTGLRSTQNTHCWPQLSIFPQVISQTWISRLQHSSLHLNGNVDTLSSIDAHCNERPELTDVFRKVSSYCIGVHNRTDSRTDRTVLLRRKRSPSPSDHNGIEESFVFHMVDTARCDIDRYRYDDCLAVHREGISRIVSHRLVTRMSRTETVQLEIGYDHSLSYWIETWRSLLIVHRCFSTGARITMLR